MARKDILKGLLEDPPEEQNPEEAGERAPSPAPPRRTGGAIGAVSRSIAELRSQSVQDIDPRMIDGGGLPDRLDRDDPELESLVQSIDEYGQQVPVLVRVNPNDPDRYQVVYGRRRVAALKRLGKPVKALVRHLDDRALVLAQGQENTARKELTFIEKANFARQMRDAGYDRKVICDALSTDKTLLSRMLQVVDAIPMELVQAIGAAPSFGRNRWLALARGLEGRDMVEAAQGETSDARFAAVMAALKTPPPRSPAPTPIAGAGGKQIGDMRRNNGKLTVTLDARAANGFDAWLAENIERIHRDWAAGRGDTGDDSPET